MPYSVLHILGTAQPEGTGVANLVASLARGLNPRDYLIHACFLAKPGPLIGKLERAGANVIDLDWQGGGQTADAWRLWRQLRAHRFSVVHQHAGGSQLPYVAKFATRAALVVHLHGRVLEAQGSDTRSACAPPTRSSLALKRWHNR